MFGATLLAALSNPILSYALAEDVTISVPPIGIGWTQIPGGLKQISVGAFGVWGVNSGDQIWFRNGIVN